MNEVYHAYSDGSHFPRAKTSGFGGFIKNQAGDVVVEFSERVRHPKYLHNYELLGMLRIVQIADSIQAKRITFHSDDKTLIEKINGLLIGSRKIENIRKEQKPELFSEILTLCSKFESFEFKHIPRTMNKHSDSLSRRYSSNLERKTAVSIAEEDKYSEQAFSQGRFPSKRIFFSHPKLVKIVERNNPYLISQARGRKVRKIVKAESKCDYSFICFEAVGDPQNESKNSLRAFLCDPNGDKKLVRSLEFKGASSEIDFFDFIRDSISSCDPNRPIWIHSNSKLANSILEQNKKISRKQFESLLNLHSVFDAFPKIMCCGFPFKYEYSPEISNREKKKTELSRDIDSIDYLIEKLQSGEAAQKSKYFGKLISCQMSKFKNLMQRDLHQIEKDELIRQTVNDLSNRGLDNLPPVKKIAP